VILSVTNGGNRQVHINQFEEFHQYTQTAGAVNHTGTEDGDIHTLLPIFKADFFTCFLALTVWAERILRMFNVNRQVLRFSVGHICREHQVISTSLVVNRFKDILCANSIYAKEVVSSITGHLGMVLISSKIDNYVIHRRRFGLASSI
jgi:hypothetical protein